MSTVGSKIECDNCGADLENGALDKCYVINRINAETGLVENLHYCLRTEEAEDGEGQIFVGCAVEVVDQNIAKYDDRHSRKRGKKRVAK